MGYDVRDFQEEVIEASHHGPVLVDFWAAWCGPCRILGPVLERLAGESEGRWRLAKVNTETHPDVAAAYGIRGIPDVRLFVDGESVDGFMGALPEAAIRRWLEGALPSPHAQASAGERARLRTLEAEGRLDEARVGWEVLLEGSPEDVEVRYHLARVLVFADPRRAVGLLERLDPPTGIPGEAVEAIRTLAGIVAEVQGNLAAGEAEPLAVPVSRLREGDVEGALEAFIARLREEGPRTDPRVRRACVALFHHLGHGHPTTLRYREAFSRALYV